MTSKGVKEGPKGSKKLQNLTFSGKIEPNRSISGVGRSRPGRAEVEGVKTDPGRARGGPSRTKNGHLWPKNGQKLAKVFDHHPGDLNHSVLYYMQVVLKVGLKCACDGKGEVIIVDHGAPWR